MKLKFVLLSAFFGFFAITNVSHAFYLPSGTDYGGTVTDLVQVGTTTSYYFESTSPDQHGNLRLYILDSDNNEWDGIMTNTGSPEPIEDKIMSLSDDEVYLLSFGDIGTGDVNLNTSPAHFIFFQTNTLPNYDILSLDSFTSTRIEWVSPITTTASTTFDVEVEYYLNSLDYSSSTYNSLLIQIDPLSDSQAQKVETSISPIYFDQLVTATTSVTVPSNGNHLGLVNVWNGVDETTDCSWWQFGCEPETLLVGLGDSVTFDVASSTYTPTLTLLNPPDYDCALDNIGGCIRNSFIYLFYPSEEVLLRFNDVNNKVSTKFPFSYAYDLKDNIEYLYNSPQTASSTVSMEFSDYGTITLFSKEQVNDVAFAGTIRTIIGYLLWIMFSLHVYRKVLKIFDNNSQVS
jgi:hypothetical protein